MMIHNNIVLLLVGFPNCLQTGYSVNCKSHYGHSKVTQLLFYSENIKIHTTNKLQYFGYPHIVEPQVALNMDDKQL